MQVEDFLESAAILRDKLSEIPYPAGKQLFCVLFCCGSSMKKVKHEKRSLNKLNVIFRSLYILFVSLLVCLVRQFLSGRAPTLRTIDSLTFELNFLLSISGFFYIKPTQIHFPDTSVK